MSANKKGRPTNEPKPNRLHIRISDEDLEHLDKYCNKHKKTRPDGVRDAIKALKI